MGDCISLVSELIPLFIKEFGFFDMKEIQIKVVVIIVTKSDAFLVGVHWFYQISRGSIQSNTLKNIINQRSTEIKCFNIYKYCVLVTDKEEAYSAQL